MINELISDVQMYQTYIRCKRIRQSPVQRHCLQLVEQFCVVEGDGVGGDELLHAVFAGAVGIGWKKGVSTRN